MIYQLTETNYGVRIDNENLQIAVLNYLSKDVGLSKNEITRLINILEEKHVCQNH